MRWYLLFDLRVTTASIIHYDNRKRTLSSALKTRATFVKSCKESIDTVVIYIYIISLDC